jgi:hypothetical protein
MPRRWLIRSLFIILAILCAVAWIGTHWRVADIGYVGKTRIGLELDEGRLGILSTNNFQDTPGWHLSLTASHDTPWQVVERTAQCHALGFAFTADPSELLVVIPLWFPTLISAFTLWFAWRKTRPKPIGRAFPVEPPAKSK